MSAFDTAAVASPNGTGNGHASVLDSPLTAAVAYAACGLRVVLLHAIDPTTGACTCREGLACAEKSRGKHPRLSRWQDTASADLDVIGGWFTQWPLSNVGILTGQTLADGTQLVVIDVDVYKGGEAALATLEGAHGRLDRAWTARTGRGGWHFWLRAPAALDLHNSADTLGDGVDVRGWHGQVVAPPSRNLGGPYTWLSREGELPPMLTESWTAVLERPPDREREAPTGEGGNVDALRVIYAELCPAPDRGGRRSRTPSHGRSATTPTGDVSTRLRSVSWPRRPRRSARRGTASDNRCPRCLPIDPSTIRRCARPTGARSRTSPSPDPGGSATSAARGGRASRRRRWRVTPSAREGHDPGRAGPARGAARRS